jgi:molybdate transport system ATP-binding protein
MSNLIVDVRVEVPGFGVDAAFAAERGITVLSGPSGSGKSLTLAAVAGTIRPVRGHIRCGDATFAEAARGVHLRSQDRHVGMVYQHAALFEHKSPLDNVALAVRDVGLAAARVIAAELLERVGVASLATAKTRSLSGGERQRVALARALAGEARVLLLDEPFSSLDATARQAMRKLVRSLVDERGVIALLVTHDAQDVDALADRVVAYEPGRTVAAAE